MADRTSKAIGLIRRDVMGGGTDLHRLAQRHGYRLVFTVVVQTGPLVTALIVAQHIYEHAATAVVVPGFEHAEPIRHVVTDLAALITPMCLYPQGHRWATADIEDTGR